MKLRVLAAVLSGAVLIAAPLTGVPYAAQDADPYVWMEEIEGARALDWAKAENARSLPQLQNDPRYAGLYADALKIVTAKDRIPTSASPATAPCATSGRTPSTCAALAHHQRGELPLGQSGVADAPRHRRAGQGRERQLGLARAPTACGPTTATAWSASPTAARTPSRCASSTPSTGKFVDGGFTLPEGKHRFDWIDKDTLLVATDWTKGERHHLGLSLHRQDR